MPEIVFAPEHMSLLKRKVKLNKANALAISITGIFFMITILILALLNKDKIQGIPGIIVLFLFALLIIGFGIFLFRKTIPYQTDLSNGKLEVYTGIIKEVTMNGQTQVIHFEEISYGAGKKEIQQFPIQYDRFQMVINVQPSKEIIEIWKAPISGEIVRIVLAETDEQ